MDGAMVEMEDVRAGYGKVEILRGVDFRAESGEITTIIGTNGSGKSTLLRTLLGFLPMRSGDIRIDGISIKDISRTELARRIAYLPQGKNVPDISAGRMVLHGRFPYLTYPRKYREADVRIARQAMEQMGVRGDFAAALPAHLPIGGPDLCALLGNALDNAMEAAEQAQDLPGHRAAGEVRGDSPAAGGRRQDCRPGAARHPAGSEDIRPDCRSGRGEGHLERHAGGDARAGYGKTALRRGRGSGKDGCGDAVFL